MALLPTQAQVQVSGLGMGGFVLALGQKGGDNTLSPSFSHFKFLWFLHDDLKGQSSISFEVDDSFFMRFILPSKFILRSTWIN